jgi:CheY-like chemotaxis protein
VVGVAAAVVADRRADVLRHLVDAPHERVDVVARIELGMLLQRGVQVVDVRLVMLPVMDLHRLRVDVRLQCAGRVWKLGERKGHSATSVKGLNVWSSRARPRTGGPRPQGHASGTPGDALAGRQCTARLMFRHTPAPCSGGLRARHPRPPIGVRARRRHAPQRTRRPTPDGADRMRILVVEDNARIAAFLQKGLREEGYVVEVASDGDTGLSKALEEGFDAAVVDVMIPGRTGVEVVRELRAREIALPVLLLTARDRTEDKVAGLDAGADDYLTKPFEFSELMARLRALLRRSGTGASAVLRVADVEMDPAMHEVRRGAAAPWS